LCIAEFLGVVAVWFAVSAVIDLGVQLITGVLDVSVFCVLCLVFFVYSTIMSLHLLLQLVYSIIVVLLFCCCFCLGLLQCAHIYGSGLRVSILFLWFYMVRAFLFMAAFLVVVAVWFAGSAVIDWGVQLIAGVVDVSVFLCAVFCICWIFYNYEFALVAAMLLHWQLLQFVSQQREQH
jgi:hypothetical protein